MIGARGRPISSMQSDAIANGSPVADGAVGGSDFKGIPVPKTESAALGGSRHHPKTESAGSWWLAPPPESGIDGLLVARAWPGPRVGTSVGNSGELSDILGP